MKKFFIVCLAALFVTAISYGQEAVESKSKIDCKPSKECAEMMGMTLEQCKALCQKTCSKTAAADKASDRQVATAVAGASQEREVEGKSCCCLAKCASKMGMTIEECLKTCASKCGKNGKAVASALMEASDEKKACCILSAKCAAKKE